MSGFGTEGFGIARAVSVDVYTDAYRVAGTVETRFSRVAETLLFGLSAHDPAVLIAAAAVLSAVAFVAGYLPARHASGISPMSALRHE